MRKPRLQQEERLRGAESQERSTLLDPLHRPATGPALPALPAQEFVCRQGRGGRQRRRTASRSAHSRARKTASTNRLQESTCCCCYYTRGTIQALKPALHHQGECLARASLLRRASPCKLRNAGRRWQTPGSPGTPALGSPHPSRHRDGRASTRGSFFFFLP